MADKFFSKGRAQQSSYAGETNNYAVIKVIGVGGGGCNAVDRMIEQGVDGIEFVTVNTDYQALDRSRASHRIQIGEKITHGLGAGANPEIGAKAAEESKEEIAQVIRGTDLLFVTAGMGGGTGSGAAPVVAQIARDLNVMTVAVVTRPFRFEGAQRMANAEASIRELEKYVDSLIVVPNDKLLEMTDEDTGLADAFSMADQVLKFGVTGISDLVAIPGLINLDLADVRRVMVDAGICHMGIGSARGQGRMELAVNEALHSPLLDTTIDGAHRLIVNFTGSNLKLREVNEASTLIRDSAAPDADIIIGAVLNPAMEDEVMITVIASGFEPQGGKFKQNQNLNLAPSYSPQMQQPENYPQANQGYSQQAAYTPDRSIRGQQESYQAEPNPFRVPDLGSQLPPQREEPQVPQFLRQEQRSPYAPQQDSSYMDPYAQPNGFTAEPQRQAPEQTQPGRSAFERRDSGRNRQIFPSSGGRENKAEETGAKRILPWFFNDSDDYDE